VKTTDSRINKCISDVQKSLSSCIHPRRREKVNSFSGIRIRRGYLLKKGKKARKEGGWGMDVKGI
jgi:hypothetical protein